MHRTSPDPRPEHSDGLSARQVALLAVACGVAAANLYYVQPLLHTLARAFGVSDGVAGCALALRSAPARTQRAG